MSRLVSLVTVQPDELKAGDVMAVVVTLHVIKRGDGLTFRVYRCGYPPQVAEGIPQGSRVSPVHDREIMQGLFPVVGWADIEPDLF